MEGDIIKGKQSSHDLASCKVNNPNGTESCKIFKFLLYILIDKLVFSLFLLTFIFLFLNAILISNSFLTYTT